MGENTKTLQKLIKMPQPLSTVKLRPHVMTHALITTITADPEAQAQETALHQAYYSNANPNRKHHSKLTKTLINVNATLTTTQHAPSL